MSQRDGFDLWNAISAHRTADAAKKSASEIARIAKVQEQNAATNRALAEARKREAQAAERAAQAAQRQTQILQEKHNQETFLTQAKSVLANLSRSLNHEKIDLDSASPTQFINLVTDQYTLQDTEATLRQAFTYEKSIAEQEHLLDLLYRTKQSSAELAKHPKIAEARRLVSAINQCATFELDIQNQSKKMQELEAAISSNMTYVNSYLGQSTDGKSLPERDSYLSIRRAAYEPALEKAFKTKLYLSAFGYPLVASGVVTFFLLGAKYALVVLALGAISVFVGKKSGESLNRLRADYQRSIKVYEEAENQKALLGDSEVLLTGEKQAFQNSLETLREIVAELTEKGSLPQDLLDAITSKFNGTRFLRA